MTQYITSTNTSIEAVTEHTQYCHRGSRNDVVLSARKCTFNCRVIVMGTILSCKCVHIISYSSTSARTFAACVQHSEKHATDACELRLVNKTCSWRTKEITPVGITHWPFSVNLTAWAQVWVMTHLSNIAFYQHSVSFYGKLSLTRTPDVSLRRWSVCGQMGLLYPMSWVPFTPHCCPVVINDEYNCASWYGQYSHKSWI